MRSMMPFNLLRGMHFLNKIDAIIFIHENPPPKKMTMEPTNNTAMTVVEAVKHIKTRVTL